MYRLLFAFAFVFCSSGLWAQSKLDEELKEELWTNASPEFKSVAVPEKWKNESAVVLASAFDYALDMKGSARYIESLNLHLRIKVQDKAAVTEYSDLSFDEKTVNSNIFGRARSYNVVAIKVVKPDGTQKEVDLKNAVKADMTSSKDLKIPIPNLEPGDIIDYFMALRTETAYAPDFGDEVLLESKYPIVVNTFKITIPRDFHFFQTSLNGSPKFLKQEIKKDEIYVLTSKMQEKAPDLLWDYESRSAPNTRYHVSYLPYEPLRTALRLMKTSFVGKNADIGFLEDFFNTNFKKEKDTRKVISELYYALRNPIYKECYFDIEQGDPLSNSYTPNKFFFVINAYLKDKKIDHEVIMLPTRFDNEIGNIVDLSRCDFVVRINTDPPIYLGRPLPFRIPNEIPYLLEGTEGASSKDTAPKIGVSQLAQNTEKTTAEVSLSGDLAKVKVKRNIVARGHIKTQHQYGIYTNYDYLKAYDQPKYLAESSHKVGAIIEQYKEQQKKFEQRQAQDYQERDERIKEKIENDMDGKVSDYALNIKSIGMWESSPDTEYDEEFSLEGITKKAGPNLIVELGKLIGTQTEVKEDKMTRTRDVYMDYPRSFSEEISFVIPNGFAIEGLENLNKSVVTEAGGFVSSSEVKGNLLIVKTRKHYNQNFYKAADWPKITGFLNAAVDFYNAKVLLKKK